MSRVRKLSKVKVQGMIERGEVKEVLTYADLMKIQEFMKLEVGFDSGKSSAWGIDKNVAGFGIRGGFNYRGENWLGVHVTHDEKLLVLNNQGGLLIKWKSVHDSIHASLVFRGDVYDTRVAEFLARMSDVIEDDDVVKVVIRDLYRTASGNIFTHFITFLTDLVPMEEINNGHKYHSVIAVLEEDELIEEYGSVKEAHDFLDEVKVNRYQPAWNTNEMSEENALVTL